MEDLPASENRIEVSGKHMNPDHDFIRSFPHHTCVRETRRYWNFLQRVANSGRPYPIGGTLFFASLARRHI